MVVNKHVCDVKTQIQKDGAARDASTRPVDHMHRGFRATWQHGVGPAQKVNTFGELLYAGGLVFVLHTSLLCDVATAPVARLKAKHH